jgi:chromosome partitioning protein
MAKIISVVSQKGGVGKTTTSINLTASIAALESRALVIGIDPQCGILASFGVDRKKEFPGMFDVLVHDTPILETITHTEIKFLDFIPAHVTTTQEEEHLHELAKRDKYKLKKKLTEIDNYYDFIVIDCPPSLGPLTISSMIAATSILIPVQGEYFSKESLRRLLKTALEITTQYNPSLYIEGVLLTMVDSRTNLGRKITEEIKKTMGEKVFSTIIPRSVRLAEAPMIKKPAILTNINSRGAQAYLTLALELLSR